MEIFILILFVITGGLFGWLCADVIEAIKEGKTRKSWLGLVVFFVGLAYVLVCDWQIRYYYDNREYNYNKYEIVNDTIITNHNGQIDTVATFKILEK